MSEPIERAALTRHEAAAYIGVSFHTLARWASEDRGPPITAKLSRHRNGRVLYLRADLDAWLRAGAPTDRRGARPSSYPPGGYGPGPAPSRRDPVGRFAPRTP
jgi:hypothetical protein